MIRPLAATLVFATLTLAGAASAQTYGQPVYLNAYGRPVGGSPLSEVETRAYVQTGRWADGYSDRPHVHVLPGYQHGYRIPYGRDRYGASGHGYGGYRQGRHDRAAGGYRDEWGYNDDRPPSARRWSDDRGSRRHDRDCGCSDVYLYDR